MNWAGRREAYRLGWRQGMAEIGGDRGEAEARAHKYARELWGQNTKDPMSWEYQLQSGYIDAVGLVGMMEEFKGDCGRLLCPLKKAGDTGKGGGHGHVC